ncbi:MAG TPA: hypothetical protein VGI92_11070 [Gemmatimonadales bacterium]|jgi:hypothetical protein
MSSRSIIIAAGAALLLAAPLAAQQAMSGMNMSGNSAGAMPDSYKQVQLAALEMQRKTLLAMADSMPERLYRQHATPIQRDFAQQIEHAAGSVGMVAAGTFHIPGPARMDTAQYLNSRAGLKGFINAQYDWATAALRNQSAADRSQTVNLFGMKTLPAWQVWDEIHEHTFWTAGQIVANFRNNGMAPPGFGFF